MREVADHQRPWVRLSVDSQGGRLGPWMFGFRRIPTYVFRWSDVERIEPVTDRYLSGPGVRFVFRTPLPALEASPNAARWPAARQLVFLCGSHLQDVLAAVPPGLVAREASPAGAPASPPAGESPRS
jgi:hypothetical protein